MGILARAPNRIDLSGGTLDIYPLYVFEGGSVTVNMAIQVYSSAKVELREDQAISFYSVDLDKNLFFATLNECFPGGELDLLIRAVRHYSKRAKYPDCQVGDMSERRKSAHLRRTKGALYSPQHGLHVVTKNDAPYGSGLGASSALLMALMSALNHVNGTQFSVSEIVDIGANLEAQTIRIPTGKQDYLAAMHGGVNALWFAETGIDIEPIPFSDQEIEALEERIILSYTGVPHFSGENNWSIMKRYIDGEDKTIAALRGIKATSLKMREAVMNKNWNQIGEILNEEWENRKKLSSGVTTNEVEHFIKEARKAGAIANKLCGAGGGGCMITWVSPDRKASVEAALAREGAKLIPFKIAKSGICLNEEATPHSHA